MSFHRKRTIVFSPQNPNYFLVGGSDIRLYKKTGYPVNFYFFSNGF